MAPKEKQEGMTEAEKRQVMKDNANALHVRWWAYVQSKNPPLLARMYNFDNDPAPGTTPAPCLGGAPTPVTGAHAVVGLLHLGCRIAGVLFWVAEHPGRIAAVLQGYWTWAAGLGLDCRINMHRACCYTQYINYFVGSLQERKSSGRGRSLWDRRLRQAAT